MPVNQELVSTGVRSGTAGGFSNEDRHLPWLPVQERWIQSAHVCSIRLLVRSKAQEQESRLSSDCLSWCQTECLTDGSGIGLMSVSFKLQIVLEVLSGDK